MFALLLLSWVLDCRIALSILDFVALGGGMDGRDGCEACLTIDVLSG